jgi:ribosomal protein S27AE
MAKQKITYKSLSKAEVQEFINDAGKKITYKMVGHSFRSSKHVPKQFCSNCGLLNLNNKFTRWAIGKGCYNEFHPGYSAAIRRYSTTKF